MATPVAEILTGRVLARFGAELIIEDATGELHRCNTRRRLPAVCGDRVEWAPQAGSNGVITAVEPRHNLLERLDPRGQIRAIAANVSQIAVITAKRPAPQWSLVDHFLVVASHLNTRALIVWNKCDLPGNDGRDALYRGLGYDVLHTSVVTGRGMDALRERLRGHTNILVGQSGVGKSSLIQALLPDACLRIGELSEHTGEGKHTTTTARLYRLPDGGELIDSPGVRDYRPPPLSAEALARGFVEFLPYLGQCRFHNCVHHQEPDCAIKAAIERGEIDRTRYGHYVALLAKGG